MELCKQDLQIIKFFYTTYDLITAKSPLNLIYINGIVSLVIITFFITRKIKINYRTNYSSHVTDKTDQS